MALARGCTGRRLQSVCRIAHYARDPAAFPFNPLVRSLTLSALRFAWKAIVLLVALFCALLLVIRYLVFPNIDAYRDQIAAKLAAQLGQPVAIEAIDTGWDGWNPRLAISNVAVRDAADPSGPPVLFLPRVQFVVAWTSLLVADLRLTELAIERPRLSIRRDAQGHLHFAGIKIDASTRDDSPSPVTEWLLRQREINVSDALVTWDDQLRSVPQLVLDHVSFRVQQRFGRLRFGLVGQPPSALASPIDFRGEISSGTANDWKTAKGHFYIHLEYADVALWREWIPPLRPIESGKGALRVWFDIEAGVPTNVTADVELADVRTRLAKDLPQLDLARMSGRILWHASPGKRELGARNLAFLLPGGEQLAPVTFSLAWNEDPDGAITAGTLSFDQLDIAPLSTLAEHLPLKETWRQNIASYALRGRVSQGKLAWRGPPDEPTGLSGSGTFFQVGLAASESLPGATGVSGNLTFDEMHGDLKFDSRDMRISLPRVFAEPLIFDTASGSVGWTRGKDGLGLTFDGIRFATPHTSGAASATWRARPKGPGVLDLKATLNRAQAQHVYRYLPLTLDPHVRDWLRLSIKDGVASDVKMVIAGDLAEFPFADAKRGKFGVTFKVNGVTLDYADGWPPVDDIVADVRFEGPGMQIVASNARILDVRTGTVKVDVPDFGVTYPLLNVVGDATGPTASFLGFIAQSPVAGWTDHATAKAEAQGSGRLTLDLTLPLGQGEGTRVAGNYQFDGNTLRFPERPALTQVRGALAFTEKSMQSRDLAAEVFGGPVRVTLASAEGGINLSATGNSQLALAKGELELPLMHRVSGSVDWQLDARIRGPASTWTLTSDLKGTAVELPAPLGKEANESVALRVERREVTGKPAEDLIVIDYGSDQRAVLHRLARGDSTVVDRALVLFGSTVASNALPDRPGVWVRGSLPELDLDEWLALYHKENAPSAGATAVPARKADTLELNGVDLTTGRLDVFGRALHDLKVVASRSGGDDWRLRLVGQEVEGTAVWRAPTANLPNGRVMARLTRLIPPGPDELHPVRSEVDLGEKAKNTWPELDIVADAFFSRDHDLGRFELLAKPSGPDWNISKMTLVNPAGRIDANGWWRIARARQSTELDVTVATEDAGAFLDRFGYPVAVKNAPSRIAGQLSWAGAPNDFDYPTLSGTFKLTTGAGQFTKIDPGIGKLLGVLSLQALPRRLTLDFRDVFSEGFAFDDIAGDFAIREGLMHTDNLKLQGPAAAVRIVGDIDLANETQRLDVRVSPALSTGVSAGAAVLFLANPIVGAAVGAGTFLAQKMFDHPIDQIFSFEYRVTGSWSDPQVERVGRQLPAALTGEAAAPRP